MIVGIALAVGMFSVGALSASAAESDAKLSKQNMKNECLLAARNCPDSRADSLFQKVDRLKGEISRGTDVYTKDELKILNKDLDDAIKATESAYGNG